MQLAEWIDRYGSSVQACSQAWQVNFQTLNEVAKRRRRASYDLGLMVERNTGGEVTLHEVCGPLPGVAAPQPRLTPSGAVVPQSRRAAAVVVSSPAADAHQRAAQRSIAAVAPPKRGRPRKVAAPVNTPRRRMQSSTPSVGA